MFFGKKLTHKWLSKVWIKKMFAYLVGAQPPPYCSFARHLYNKENGHPGCKNACASRSAQPSCYFFDTTRAITVFVHPRICHLSGFWRHFGLSIFCPTVLNHHRSPYLEDGPPLSNWLRGLQLGQPYLGDLLTMVLNHLHNGMILQVRIECPHSNWISSGCVFLFANPSG